MGWSPGNGVACLADCHGAAISEGVFNLLVGDLYLLAPQSVRGAYRDFHPIPSTFEHLRLYTKKLSLSAGYSQVQPDTVPTRPILCYIFKKAGASRISNMILRGMSEASSVACLGHVWDIIWGMAGASSGASSEGMYVAV